MLFRTYSGIVFDREPELWLNRPSPVGLVDPLALSPALIQQVVTGTGHGANGLYVLLAIWWLLKATRKWP